MYEAQPPKQNAYGYTFSSTAQSLPAHHYKPHPSERPDLSEEELRHTLEEQIKTMKPRYLASHSVYLCLSLPIEGTNVRLNSVEDIMAWREERKKKWLSKIASAVGSISDVAD